MNAELHSQDDCRCSAIPSRNLEHLGPESPTPDLGERVRELEHELATIRAALDTRDMIGMAKGILIAREKCTPERAFEILKRASQRRNRRLAEIAAELVQSNTRVERAARGQVLRTTLGGTGVHPGGRRRQGATQAS